MRPSSHPSHQQLFNLSANATGATTPPTYACEQRALRGSCELLARLASGPTCWIVKRGCLVTMSVASPQPRAGELRCPPGSTPPKATAATASFSYWVGSNYRELFVCGLGGADGKRPALKLQPGPPHRLGPAKHTRAFSLSHTQPLPYPAYPAVDPFSPYGAQRAAAAHACVAPGAFRARMPSHRGHPGRSATSAPCL